MYLLIGGFYIRTRSKTKRTCGGSILTMSGSHMGHNVKKEGKIMKMRFSGECPPFSPKI